MLDLLEADINLMSQDLERLLAEVLESSNQGAPPEPPQVK
jgi:hypothetical protein